jgi:hypothetical protein
VDPGRGHHRAHLLRVPIVPTRTAPPPRRRRNPVETEPKKKKSKGKFKPKSRTPQPATNSRRHFKSNPSDSSPRSRRRLLPLERGPLAANLGPISLLGFGWLRIEGASVWDRPRVGSAVSDPAPLPPRLLMVGGGGREGGGGGCGGRG